MSGRGTLVLLVLALGLAGFYYFWEVRGGEDRKAEQEETQQLFGLKKEDVTGIETVRGSDTLLVERQGDHWDMKRPLMAGADPSGMDAAVSAIIDGKIEEVLPSSGSDLAGYGLDPAALRVTVRSPGAAGEKTLLLGEFNPTQSFAYAMRPGASEVLLVSAALRRALDKAPDEFRDRTVMNVEPEKVQRFTVHQTEPSQDVVLERDQERWRVAAPLVARADKMTVEQTLRQLGSARVREFVAENPVDLDAYGLATPRLTVRVEEGTDAAAKVLAIGRLDQERGGYYARREGRPAVFLLPDDSMIKFLSRGPEEYRAKTLLDFEQADVGRVRLVAGGNAWTLVRGEEKDPQAPSSSTWTREDDGKTLDASKMSDLLWNLKRLRFTEVVTEAVDAPAIYGLEPPRLEFGLYGREGQELALLRLGKELDTDGRCYAMNGAEKVLYTVPGSSAKLYPTSPDSLLP